MHKPILSIANIGDFCLRPLQCGLESGNEMIGVREKHLRDEKTSPKVVIAISTYTIAISIEKFPSNDTNPLIVIARHEAILFHKNRNHHDERLLRASQ